MTLSGRWPLTGAESVRDALLQAYADPGRGYHDLRHLEEVLDRVDELEAAGVDFDGRPVRLAAWFHDAVYDGQPAAEERSAVSASQTLTGLPANEALKTVEVAEVARLVRLTEHHRPADGDANGCVLVDADLAILAAPPQRYADYVAGVRWEYRAFSDAEFRRGRAAVLRDLAAKEHLFHTRWARDRWEAAARSNLAAELVELEG